MYQVKLVLSFYYQKQIQFHYYYPNNQLLNVDFDYDVVI